MTDAAMKLVDLNRQELLEQFKAHEHFCRCMLDAYVLMDDEGRVIKSNPLFSTLTGLKSKQILKANSIDDIISFKVGNDALKAKSLLENVSPTRIDEVYGETTDGRDDLNLIIGYYPFLHDGTKVLGAFLLIRDVTAETNLQGKYHDKATQSITDTLTGLFNRSYLTEFLNTQLTTLENLPKDAHQRAMTIIMADIDYFKKINDNFGHQAGDYVLKHVADLMKKTFRKTDVICRYGGEEFLIILPGTNLQGAAIAANNFREAIDRYPFEFESKKIPVTISSGASEIVIGQENADQTIAKADHALYYSKEHGRNQVSIHEGKKIKTFKSGPARN